MSLNSINIKIVVPNPDAENAILGHLKTETHNSRSVMGGICGSVCMPPSVCHGRCATCACNSRENGRESSPRAVAFSG